MERGVKMEIVINIPDGCYEELTTANFPIQDAYRFVEWIKDGIPLPKGHGRLIDCDNLLRTLNKEHLEYDPDVNYFLCHANTIIEADKEVK